MYLQTCMIGASHGLPGAASISNSLQRSMLKLRTKAPWIQQSLLHCTWPATNAPMHAPCCNHMSQHKSDCIALGAELQEHHCRVQTLDKKKSSRFENMELSCKNRIQSRRWSCVQVLSVLIACAVVADFRVDAQLTVGFYEGKCGNASVETLIQQAVANSSSVAGNIPGVVRLFFHDCFIRGCDASVLLDGATSEQTGGPNVNSLRGFGVIDLAKSALEAACPGVVSCADIVAYAARDSVVIAGGPYWNVEAGRRDGSISQASDTSGLTGLPGPNSNLSALTARFALAGLDQTDLIALSGAHTIGQSHCRLIAGRLSGNDTTLDADYKAQLITECPLDGSQAATLIDMDPTSPAAFDSDYYVNLQGHRGLFVSDQELFDDADTTGTVQQFATESVFFAAFTNAMIKMGQNSVLTGTDGQIRSNCHAVNS